MMFKIISQNFLWNKDIHLNYFIPKANGFEPRIISADNHASNVSISKIHAPCNITDFMPGTYVACMYDGNF